MGALRGRCSRNVVDHGVYKPGNDNRLATKRLVLPKGAGEVRNHLLLLFRHKGLMQPRNASPLLPGDPGRRGDLTYYAIVSWHEGGPEEHVQFRRQFYAFNLNTRGRDKRLNFNSDLVFVRDVQFVEPVEVIFPAEIRLGLAYCLDDLFAARFISRLLIAASRRSAFSQNGNWTLSGLVGPSGEIISQTSWSRAERRL